MVQCVYGHLKKITDNYKGKMKLFWKTGCSNSELIKFLHGKFIIYIHSYPIHHRTVNSHFSLNLKIYLKLQFYLVKKITK